MNICMKRTTLILEDAIMEGIREAAHASRRDMSVVVNEFLREGLQRHAMAGPAEAELPSFAMGRPRVNLADRDILEQIMEAP